MKTLLIAALFTTLSLPAWADVQCSGSLKDRSISDNIFVGKQCTLINVQVDGNVMLADGAKAILRNSHIDGNLESKAVLHSWWRPITALKAIFNWNAAS